MSTKLVLLAIASASVAGPAAPSLTQLDGDGALPTFRIASSYHPASGNQAGLRVIGGSAVTLPRGEHIISAHAQGFGPLELKLDDGRCFSVKASISGHSYRAGRADQADCETPRKEIGGSPVAPRPGLKYVGRSWGFDAWQDDQTGQSLFTDAWSDDRPLVFTSSMKVVGLGAMRSPDAAAATISLVGDFDGQPSVIMVYLTF